MRSIGGVLEGKSIRGMAAIILVGWFMYAAPAHAKDCGSGVQLQLSAPDTAQGSLLLATVRSAKPLGDVSGTWNERKVSFWRAGANEGTAEDVRHALLGVDLQKPAGKYEFTVAAETGNGERVGCRVPVEVEEGHFATENLTVKRKFVEPDPAELARAEAETKRLREIFDHVTPERLWSGPFRVPLD